MNALEQILPPIIKIIIAIGIIFPFIWWATVSVKNYLNRVINPLVATLLSRIVYYFALLLGGIFILQLMGIQTSALIATMGIVGIGLSLAAQTSLSNIISGIFIVMENNIKIGDQIIFDEMKGTVDSVNLFSVYLHTDDNKFLRIPNEALLKRPFINLTYFPEKRETKNNH